MAKKPPGRLKQALRQIQLVLSVGVASLVTYAVLDSSLILHLGAPSLPSGFLRPVAMALLSRGLLLLIAPAFCFAAARLIDLNPWGLGLGTAVFVEFALDFLIWADGELEEEGVLAGVAGQVVVSLVAGVLASFAARKALAMARTAEAAEGRPPGKTEAQAALEARDFSEKMRQAQDGALPSEPAAPPPVQRKDP